MSCKTRKISGKINQKRLKLVKNLERGVVVYLRISLDSARGAGSKNWSMMPVSVLLSQSGFALFMPLF